jgi:isopentenyl diphosphate isomerase/L-lactate dehydrogenase-like FMN-dependent dehydrogenase
MQKEQLILVHCDNGFNHGGRQLDGSRSPFDQVKELSDAVGDKLEIILDGGIRREHMF